MAISTYGITLKSGASAGSLTKLCDISSFPDLGGTYEALDVTTLSDAAQVFIKGIRSSGSLEFGAFYDSDVYDDILTRMDTDSYYALEFGINGDAGVFEWQGSHSVNVVGGAVNAPVEMRVTIIPSTEIVKATD